MAALSTSSDWVILPLCRISSPQLRAELILCSLSHQWKVCGVPRDVCCSPGMQRRQPRSSCFSWGALRYPTDPHWENKNKPQNPNPEADVETRGFLKASANCIYFLKFFFPHSEFYISSPGEYHGSLCMVTVAEVWHRQLLFSNTIKGTAKGKWSVWDIWKHSLCSGFGKEQARFLPQKNFSKRERFEGNLKLAEKKRKNKLRKFILAYDFIS